MTVCIHVLCCQSYFLCRIITVSNSPKHSGELLASFDVHCYLCVSMLFQTALICPGQFVKNLTEVLEL